MVEASGSAKETFLVLVAGVPALLGARAVLRGAGASVAVAAEGVAAVAVGWLASLVGRVGNGVLIIRSSVTTKSSGSEYSKSMASSSFMLVLMEVPVDGWKTAAGAVAGRFGVTVVVVVDVLAEVALLLVLVPAVLLLAGGTAAD